MNFRIASALLVLSAVACTPSPETAETTAATPSGEAADPASAPADALPDDAPHPGTPGFPEAVQPQRDTTSVDTDVVGVRLSNVGDTEEQTIGATTSSFDPTDTVYAEITTNGSADAYTLYAKWVAPDGTELADYGVRINEAGPKHTVISLSKPDGWASGQGRIEIAINGEAEETVTFDVP